MANSTAANRHGLSKPKVFLGFEDELITKQYDSYLCYTTNKVGGKPDWGGEKLFTNPKCALCGLSLPLIVQIYAPLESSQYHRTLYLFGCVNPSCWNKKESWVCLRRQIIDKSFAESTSQKKTISSFDWCEGANDWEDFETDGSSESLGEQETTVESDKFIDKMAELGVNESVVEEKYFNQSSFSMATAEVDDDQKDPVMAEIPIEAQVDVAALYHQVKPVPQLPPESLQFKSFFISVCEEREEKILNNDIDNKEIIADGDPNMIIQTNVTSVNNDASFEKYEKILPAHGDKLFHNFISRIQRNPGQILRYIRDCGTPLFLYPVEDAPRHCPHCESELVYELQLLPTLISRLLLEDSGPGHIDYGTVFVLACKQSCWDPQDSVRTEQVIVQREL